MNIKTFNAQSIREAIRMVKSAMGPEAVILKTRTVREPALAGAAGTPRIEVTAAVDYDASGPGRSKGEALDLAHIIRKWQSLETELRDLKQSMMLSDASRLLKPELYFNREVRARYLHFKYFGLRPEIIIELMESAPAERAGEVAENKLLQNSLGRVMNRVRLEADALAGGRAKVFAFIGPTGVGKTTTLAKLAALAALKQGRKAALITMDTFRIAAVAQLETYARIMGLPMSVANDGKQLRSVIRRYADRDCILIDTAGRSPQKDQDIAALKEFFDIPERIHHFLVLSATTRYDNLVHIGKRFGRLPIGSCIFTKLDETRDFSAMLNFLLSSGRPLSYLTAGQQVPEDIETASKKKLAALLLSRMREPRKIPAEVKQYGSGSRA